MSADKKDDKTNGQDCESRAAEAPVFVGETYLEDPYAVRIVEIPEDKWLRRYRSVAFQMVLLSLLSFSGPSMSNGKDSACLETSYLLTR